ncbi:hypothetical protein ACVW00_002920 [Marmoricola sp. URHA0025 HA25]
MNENELQETLRRGANVEPSYDALGPSLRAARRIRARRRGASVIASVVAVLAAIVLVSRLSSPSDRPQPIAPTPSPKHTATISLSSLPGLPLPPLDRLDTDFVFHGADGRSFELASPDTLADVEPNKVEGAAGLVTLHRTSTGFSFAIDGGQPQQVVTAGPGEDYRALASGPGGAVYLPGAPGQLVVVQPDGHTAHVPLPASRVDDIEATAGYYWAVWNHRIWRLDPADVAAGWNDLGPGDSMSALYASRAVWVQVSGECWDLHDEASYKVLWQGCAGQVVDYASPDGRYALRTGDARPSDDGSLLQVVEARTGRVVLQADAGAGRTVVVGDPGTWAGDVVIARLDADSEDGREAVACDVAELSCGKVSFPDNVFWWGTPYTG